MNVFASWAGALAAAILSISASLPMSNPHQAESKNSVDISVTAPEKTIGSAEIKAAEFIAPPPPAPAPKPTPAPVASFGAPAPQPVGTKDDWLAASGIASSDWGYVDYIISRESGWNPNSTNASSGAHGLPQALPYSKTGCGWVDAVCQLRWANGYAVSRYGSWAAAYNYWVSHRYW